MESSRCFGAREALQKEDFAGWVAVRELAIQTLEFPRVVVELAADEDKRGVGQARLPEGAQGELLILAFAVIGNAQKDQLITQARGCAETSFAGAGGEIGAVWNHRAPAITRPPGR